MSGYITSSQAQNHLNHLTLSEADQALLDQLIASCSRAIDAFCGRSFGAEQYDEVYPGQPLPTLLLRNYPIVSVERVLGDPQAVLRVVNLSDAVQRAGVRVTGSGLVLVRANAGVITSVPMSFGSFPTLTALASAINALGEGWSAEVVPGQDGLRASADLRALQGSFAAWKRPAMLRIHLQEISDFTIDEELGGLLRSDWEGGRQHWRVIYAAGFATVPPDVQEACAQWVATLFWQAKRDPGLEADMMGGVQRRPARDLPGPVKRLLGPYRRCQI